MPQTVAMGSQGPTVRTLQERLNKALPLTPLVVVDGIFGPLTLKRVRAFQTQHGLSVDGIVGPVTWAAIDKACDGSVTPIPPNAYGWERCGCAAIWQRGVSPFFRKAGYSLAQDRYASGFAPMNRRSSFAATADSDAGGAIPLGVDVTKVPDSVIAILDPYYGRSIDYSNVRMTNQTGIGDRAFVLTVYKSPLPRWTAISFVNIGTNYKEHTLIHEFGHVWQAQHHSDPTAYMVNALASQGLEAANNALDQTDQWSAYAYRKGKEFGDYGAEQLAQMIANNETAIVNHVNSVGTWTVDTSLLSDPTRPFVENKSYSGVKI